MAKSEFEEKSYEAPLYNQLERRNALIFTPGQVLESVVGFDRAVLLMNEAIWEVLGYTSAPVGAALPYYNWPSHWGPRNPRRHLPSFRLNLFLQAKRPAHYKRKPRAIKKQNSIAAPLWSFDITPKQQRLLETLATRLGRRVHVAYACPAFHTSLALFMHTKRRTIVENSTFPSVGILKGHSAWYYDRPGATGIANPDPEALNEPPLLERLSRLADGAEVEEGLTWLDSTARLTIAAFNEAIEVPDAVDAQFADDLHALERLAESYGLAPSLQAYAQLAIFAARYDLSWLVVAQ